MGAAVQATLGWQQNTLPNWPRYVTFLYLGLHYTLIHVCIICISLDRMFPLVTHVQ